ncbi:16S rRNA (cytosine(1402)-N(4))-methyltransferase RsmH [Alcanivorax sp. 1008]|uniref:16S rRNA (cytosine(1402)-N(4))-methyltransferase RsmH n=1 Tax=Alcanivorax sp. 1008 TaxID=2816853 RepID=UPI001D8CB41E|nr:16S rRNA (cytosine(1402)-N(4))-methyltransferase RsmH [Alcanivorax sp. 1008]MCC1495264.1 16S rRNA (cytosine(1402)-N(4))-methyltransferase RsmH [Alcanivorax sp. 1008]
MATAEQFAHQSVMLDEVLEMLPTRADGFYVDATFGRGGHSRALLDRLGAGARLIGIDQDPEAVIIGQQLERADARFRIVAGRFDCLDQVVAEEGRLIDGLLMDLGVSSPQLDDAARGFSFLRDGPLDMRMNPNVGESAAQWLARADEKDIADVLYRFGEEKKSRRIARMICETRKESPLTRTTELAALCGRAIGRGEPGKHPATRTFQAIRIYINQELGALENLLAQTIDCLAAGGRLAVISFHSLEDRIVKQFIRDESGRAPMPRGLPIEMPAPRLQPLGKARHASDAEVKRNPRARSAVLRVAERVGA